MKKDEIFSVGILIIFTAAQASDETSTFREVICEGEGVRLSCENDVIEILSAQVTQVPDNSSCTVEFITPQVNDDFWRTCNYSYPLPRCHGNTTCLVSPDWIKWCTKRREQNNVLLIKYSCYNLEEAVSSGEEATDEVVDIISPNFRGFVPPQEFQMRCKVQMSTTSDSDMTSIRVIVKLIVFKETERYCDESLFIEEHNKTLRVCSSDRRIEMREEMSKIIWLAQSGNQAFQGNHNDPQSVASEPRERCYHFVYMKKGNLRGRRFWIQLKASDNIDVQCEQKNINESFQHDEQCTDLPLPPESFDGDAESDTSLPVIIGIALGCLILIIFIIMIVFFFKRRSKKVPSTIESPPAAKSAAVTRKRPSAPPPEVPTSSSSPYPRGRHLHPYDNVVLGKVEQTYAIVDKANKTKVKNANPEPEDDTIMVENDGLYTTSGDVIATVVEADDVTDIVVDADDVIMCENEDLYEAAGGPDEAGDDEQGDMEDDPTIMCENNDLYEPTRDPTQQ